LKDVATDDPPRNSSCPKTVLLIEQRRNLPSVQETTVTLKSCINDALNKGKGSINIRTFICMLGIFAKFRSEVDLTAFCETRSKRSVEVYRSRNLRSAPTDRDRHYCGMSK
jgi:hypothetical protein